MSLFDLFADQPLTATAEGQAPAEGVRGQANIYLYGLGPIAEQADAWAYPLSDGTNTPRQMTDQTGTVTLSGSYTPWGDVLDYTGEGNFTWGYFGGMMDAATGLLYVGNGQYYDPATGRFLTREAQPGSTNPYILWSQGISGLFLAPLVLAAMFVNRKRRKDQVGYLVILFLVALYAGMTITACNMPISPIATMTSTTTGTPTFPPTATGTFTPFPTSTPSSTPTFGPPYDNVPTPIFPTNVEGWNPSIYVPLAWATLPNAAYSQYTLIGEEKGSRGFNLCGQIALSMVASTIAAGNNREFLIQIINNTPADDVGLTTAFQLQEGVLKTFPTNWVTKASSLGTVLTKSMSGIYDYEPSSYWYGDGGIFNEDTAAEYLKNAIDEPNRHYILALINIEITNGWIEVIKRYDDPNLNIGHWVVITGFSYPWYSDNENNNWVRINDPFNNRTVYYPWPVFYSSMISYSLLELWPG